MYDFLDQNIPIITAEKQTVKAENSSKDLTFRVAFESFSFTYCLLKRETRDYC